MYDLHAHAHDMDMDMDMDMHMCTRPFKSSGAHCTTAIYGLPHSHFIMCTTSRRPCPMLFARDDMWLFRPARFFCAATTSSSSAGPLLRLQQYFSILHVATPKILQHQSYILLKW